MCPGLSGCNVCCCGFRTVFILEPRPARAWGAVVSSRHSAGEKQYEKQKPNREFESNSWRISLHLWKHLASLQTGENSPRSTPLRLAKKIHAQEDKHQRWVWQIYCLICNIQSMSHCLTTSQCKPRSAIVTLEGNLDPLKGSTERMKTCMLGNTAMHMWLRSV